MSPASHPGSEPSRALRTRQQLLAHGTAFNQFAQTCLLQAGAGELDADSLFDALQPLLGALQAPFNPGTAGVQAGFAPDSGADWLATWLKDSMADAAGLETERLLDWQSAVTRCRSHWLALGQTARGEFRKRIERLPKADLSLAQIYRQWAEGYESCYLRMLRKPAFLRDHARLLNTALDLAEHWRQQHRDWNRIAGWPDREEIDRLVSELDRLRRRCRDLNPDGGEPL